MRYYLVADFGGTQIRAASYPTEGFTALRQIKIPTRGKGTTFERLAEALHRAMPADSKPLALAVAAAGPTNPETGVFDPVNIPDMRNFPLRQALEAEFNLPVRIGNDANLAALGEWKFGAGQGYHDLIYLTISTGIGGGVIANNQLLVGAHGLAAELGHILLQEDGPLCGCGRRGCLEAFSSGTGIAAYVRQQLAQGCPSKLPADPPPTARDVARAACSGDDLGREALARAGKYLGLAITNFIATFNPQVIILGGSVTQSGDLLFAPMQAAIEANILAPAYLQDLQILPAALGDDVGLLGALALVTQ